MSRFNNSYANRGRQLETELEVTHQYYNSRRIAKIQKIPIPVKVLDLNPRTGKINKAFYEQKSTVDYIGTYQGRTVVFDAKETNVESRFDLKNIKEHQYQYLKDQHMCGAIAFLLIRFSKLATANNSETYYLPFSVLAEYMVNSKKGGRKSIPYQVIAKEKYKVEAKNSALVDYLSIVNEIIEHK
ncbi:Holliday junction resolvase RecU [Fuchsiella alkaliacetigena]|uniref:Holliday junction resolvase RecU n=1 Tax=Fuchsiella alkaliacetigena TaxID=957042 RepID=UPI00200AB1EF|nr:Holliday junction resolvase RecU [Fuchsiella alkaliacetigena]MCK8823475.1 Holliday junction resolvase RecU [Fuchsiella alkaliacetigena]